MVLDPFSALSLATSVVQFVDFGSKLFTLSLDVRRSTSGASKETGNLITQANDLQTICSQLTLPSTHFSVGHGSTPDDAALTILAQDCKATGEELLHALRCLVATKQNGWSSFRVALATLWKQDRIDATLGRLESYKSQMTLHLVLQMKGYQASQSSTIFATLQSMEDVNRHLATIMDSRISEMKVSIGEAIQQVAQEFRFQLREHKMKYNPEIDEVLDAKKNVKAGLASNHPRPAPLPPPPQKPAPERIKYASNRLKELADSGKFMATALTILKSLQYSNMTFRHSSIANAHPYTFQWMFSGNFVDWLESHESIYWISGKPGSGKSTLMKHLIDNSETVEHLHKWSGGQRLVTASFFFWALGNNMQKSQKGLFQSLLYELLAKCPELIPSTFPARWQKAELHQLELDPDSWTQQELSDGFRLFKQCGTSTKFCFFIDGLDEYEGDHHQLISVVKEIVDCPNIKICISSRPWNIFEAAFGHNSVRKVYVQDLNERDIQTYVRDKLEERLDFQQMKGQDHRCHELVVELVEKAQGVFLWVHLVVQSLIEGLHNCDRIVDLQRRLREFPSDLEQYFQHIFDSLDPIYRTQTARAFHIALAVSYPMTLLNYWFLDSEEEDPQFALKCKVIPLSELERESRHSTMQKRLNGRCKGLLEATNLTESGLVIQYRVDFLHRTVKDFLMTKGMQSMLSDWTTTGFNPHIIICKTILAEIKTMHITPEDFENLGPLSDLVVELLAHAREVELINNYTPRELLDDLERTVAALTFKIYMENPHQPLQIGSYPWSNWSSLDRRLRTSSKASFLTFTIERNLVLYVQSKLAELSCQASKPVLATGRPLLDYIVGDRDRVWREQERLDHALMVKLLLAQGANPNELWNFASVWGNYLYFLTDCTDNWPRHLYYELCKSFVASGAEIQQPVPYRSLDGIDFTSTLLPIERIAKILPQQDVAALLACAPIPKSGAKTKRIKPWKWIKNRTGTRD